MRADKFKSVEELEKVQGVGFNDMQRVKAKLNLKSEAKAKKAEPKKKFKKKKK